MDSTELFPSIWEGAHTQGTIGLHYGMEPNHTCSMTERPRRHDLAA